MRDHDAQSKRGSDTTTTLAPQTGADPGSLLIENEAPPWLSAHRVTVPVRVSGYLERATLRERCLPTRQRITLLKAPGGFGKTVLLSACCRALARSGLPTAWLTLDEQDEPPVLETYLAYACMRAGLDIFETMRANDIRLPSAYSRIDILMRALESRIEPFVLALDELEQVTNPESVALLSRLVRSRAPGLHLAIACRELPAGLAIADAHFEADVAVLTADDLRFSKPEISRFFGWRLPREQLDAVARESSGWPIALRIYGNGGAPLGGARAGVARELVDNWVTSRLWSDLSTDDQEFLLDVGLLDWVDGELLDEALGGTGLKRRLDGLRRMAGLFEPVRGAGGNIWRLHQLIREYCAKRRRQETPQRYKSIHRRLAVALARRGDAVAAMRHAKEAEDTALAGRLLTDAGGVRLCLLEGPDRLVAADRHLTDEMLETFPQLVPVRAVAHIVKGRVKEARQLLDAHALDSAGRDGGEDLDGVADLDGDADWCLARSLLNQNGCEPVGSDRFRRMVSELERLATSSRVAPSARAAFEYGLCQVHNLRGEFEAAQRLGDRACQWLSPDANYVRLAVEFVFGQIAMAQGRAAAAAAWYESGRKIARRYFLNDSRLTVLGDVLHRELDLECNRVAGNGDVARIPRRFWTTGSQFASYAAASATAAELALMRGGPIEAVSLVNAMLDHAHEAGLTAMVRYLGGLRVLILADAGKTTEAKASWANAALPNSPAGCLDLENQSWREMEVLSCARLRLHIACGELDAGRVFVERLLGLVSRRGLRRTQMRGLALAMALEESAGDRMAALGHLTAFLDLFAETGYARSLVRNPESAVPLLTAFLDARPDSPHRPAAQALLAASQVGEAIVVPTLSPREVNVLKRLPLQTYQEIAVELGMTRDGVRYHMRRLFDKLQVRDRNAVVRRARALGLLPYDG